MSSPGGRTFYLTTPIYYVNAVPHLGHAYTTIVADAMCRYRRLAGEEVYFLTGTDEHGDKIAQAAAKAGETPQAYADRIATAFQETWRRLQITHNDFIRTTEDRHKKVVQAVLQKLYDAGELYFGDYGGLYCYGCERFYTEKELVDGKCPDHQVPPTFIKEQNYFFRMSRHQEWLVRHIEEHPDFIRPERYRNEVLGFLREPLEDLCISRPRARLEWGIPLPFDERYVTYVWFDALINYVSALGWPDGELFRQFWPSAQHLIGKDILKPHAVYWPTMLKAAGIEPYRHLNVHGYWLLETGKISKSVGNVVEALELADTYGLDAFRYFVLREMTFGLDARFSEEALVGRLNADLANDLGNLVARVTTMIVNYAGGKAPSPGSLLAEDAALPTSVVHASNRARDEVKKAMEEFAFQRALGALWEFIGVVNRYIDMTQPWRLAKEAKREENEARLGRASLAPLSLKRDELNYVLYVLGKALCFLGIMLDPFLPDAAKRIRDALGQTSEPRFDDAEWSRLPLAPGTPVKKLSGLFPRVEATGEASRSTTAKPEVAKGKAPREAAAGPEPAVSGQISIEEFSRMDLRVAEVVAAEPVPKSKKLLKLTVRLGEETRTVVAGIAGHYRPEELPGRKVIVVANLEPATLMGVESQGMVLAASEGGALALLTLDRDLPPGAKVT